MALDALLLQFIPMDSNDLSRKITQQGMTASKVAEKWRSYLLKYNVFRTDYVTHTKFQVQTTILRSVHKYTIWPTIS